MNSFLKKMAVLFATLCVQACSTLEGPEIVALDKSEIVVKAEISSDFVMIRKGDTLQLTFAAIAMDNSRVPIIEDSVTWLSQDTSQLKVDHVGRIVGIVASSVPIRVILSYKHNLNTVVDTALVYITNDKYDSATIKLVQLDSNIIGAGGFFLGVAYPRVRVDVYKDGIRIVKGAQIPVAVPKPMEMQLSIGGGPEGETVYNVTNDAGKIGKFWVKSSLNLYGNIVSDSLMFIGQYPVFGGGTWKWIFANENGSVIPFNLDPHDLEPQLQRCGVFVISNLTSKPIDVVFSDSVDVVSGCDSLSLPGLYALQGNLLSIPPFGRGNRRAGKAGIVSYWVRDAVTKEMLPYKGRYESISSL